MQKYQEWNKDSSVMGERKGYFFTEFYLECDPWGILINRQSEEANNESFALKDTLTNAVIFPSSPSQC